MMRFLIPFIAAVVLSACSYSRLLDGNDEGHPVDSKTLYSSAFVFPDDYDWRKDSLGGDVPVKLVMFNGKDSVLALDVSPGNQVSPDADMHRIEDGRLYCDYSTADATIISCNGVEILRWSGRESIVDFRIVDGDIFSLGEARSGRGWSFRKNGEVILDRDNGYLTSTLYKDRDSLCFSFVEPILYEGKEAGRRYFYTWGSTVTQLVPGSDISAVHAIRTFNGKVNFLASSSALDGLLWQKGNETVLMDLKYAEKTRSHGFIVAGGELYARAQRKVFWWIDTFWTGSVIANTSGSAYQVCAIRDDSPSLCYIFSRNGGTSELGVNLGEDRHFLPSRLRMSCGNAFCCSKRECCIGLNDASDNYRPIIIKGVDTLKFDFNGYFTCLDLP